ncbi:hypothetical protein BH10ACI4_BH10ACI4_25200 [soil metagenome]
MLRFKAQEFIRASSIIAQMYSQVANGTPPTRGAWEMVATAFASLEMQCEELQLVATLAQMERVKSMVGTTDFRTFSAALMEVNSRLVDELRSRHIYCVASLSSGYLESNKFAHPASDRFPEAIADMDEAARCFAFERPTACIFHLMRVTECALWEIAQLLNITDHNPTWEPIIRKIDAELKLDYRARQYQGNQDLLANMSTHLHAVKVAWRNKTMHIEKINTMVQAGEIYAATCGLMRYLGENLPRPKLGTAKSIRKTLKR